MVAGVLLFGPTLWSRMNLSDLGLCSNVWSLYYGGFMVQVWYA